MTVIYFFYGLSFSSLGLAAFLQLRRGGDFPLFRLLPWLAAFGLVTGATGWVEMFLVSELNASTAAVLQTLRIILQTISGLLLLIFGWGLFARLQPLPSWAIFVPGLLMVPFAFVVTYAVSTFVTPSPIEIPIDIWSRYLLYLPGSTLAGFGFIRQWNAQRKQGYADVANLMLGAGIAFLVEAFVMGLVVPAAPYGPASYYNYDRVAYNAFTKEAAGAATRYGLTSWLDYQQILETTGLPIQLWRTLSAFAVTFFVVRGLDVFETMQKRLLKSLQDERDRARQATLESQIAGRQAAERWTETLVRVGSLIAELEDVDQILLYIVANARSLLAADFMGLALLDSDSLSPQLKCYADAANTRLVGVPIPVENSLILEVIHSQTTYSSPQDLPAEQLYGACFYTESSARAIGAVCLKMNAYPVGVLWIARFKPRPFTETDLIWLEGLADQVVIAIKHGIMTSQLQSLSVSEERARIARDMHDGLAQVLGYMNLQVQTLDAYLQQGKLNRLQENLAQMRKAVNTAHADVREKILSLRTTLSSEKGVIQASQEYLEEFGIQTHIETKFINQVYGELNLASLAEVQLVCILQEALTNVRKHAQADSVIVTMRKRTEATTEFIEMEIIDDGVGFVESRSKGSFGIQIMRERAQSVGGSLEVISSLDRGSLIRCLIPCLPRESRQKMTVLLP